MEEKDVLDKVVRGGFQISLNISGRTISMSGYINDGETKADLNRRLDEFQEIIDRQLIKADIKNQEGQLKIDLLNLEHLTNEYEKIIKRKQAWIKKEANSKAPTSQMNNTLANYDATVSNIKEQIKTREEIIRKNKEAVAQL